MPGFEAKEGYTLRACDVCNNDRNLRRGWGLCCSKKCAAKKREKSKPGYNPERVLKNNHRRANWHNNGFNGWDGQQERDELGNVKCTDTFQTKNNMAKKQKGLTAEQVKRLIKATEALEKYAHIEHEPMAVVGYARQFAKTQLQQLKGEFPL